MNCPICDGTTEHSPECLGQLDPTLTHAGLDIAAMTKQEILANATPSIGVFEADCSNDANEPFDFTLRTMDEDGSIVASVPDRELADRIALSMNTYEEREALIGQLVAALEPIPEKFAVLLRAVGNPESTVSINKYINDAKAALSAAKQAVNP